jgi:hypothetical protein
MVAFFKADAPEPETEPPGRFPDINAERERRVRRAALFEAQQGRRRLDNEPLTDAQMLELVDGIIARGVTELRAIARELNDQYVPGARRGRWHATSVKRLLARRGGDRE